MRGSEQRLFRFHIRVLLGTYPMIRQRDICTKQTGRRKTLIVQSLQLITVVVASVIVVVVVIMTIVIVALAVITSRLIITA